MNISFAVTAYQETTNIGDNGAHILRCLQAAVEHPKISEIVVVDDASEDFLLLQQLLQATPKLSLYHNSTNYGVFGNKLEAVAQAKGDLVISCDSDNVMDKDFIDCAIAKSSDEMTWLCPSYAKPLFNYTDLTGLYTSENAYLLPQKRHGISLLNTGNQTFFRKPFLERFGKYRGKRFDLMQVNYFSNLQEERHSQKWKDIYNACDSFFFNLEWLQSGGKLDVITGMQYSHFVGDAETSNYNRAPRQKKQLAKKLVEQLGSATIRQE